MPATAVRQSRAYCGVCQKTMETGTSLLTVKVKVTMTALLNFVGCLMSLYMFGKTECPPHGDMSSPNESGKVSQFEGKK